MFKRIKERIEERKKDKEFLKELALKESELEKDIPDDKLNLKEIFSLLKGNSEEDKEYLSYLTEEEKKALEDEKKENKMLTIKVGLVYGCVLVGGIVLLNVFVKYFQSDLYKVTEPLLESAYEEKYDTSLEVDTIEELTYINEDNEEVNSGIVLLTSKNDEHMMCINNETIGDDVQVKNINNDFLAYIQNTILHVSIINHDVLLSYEDYYLEYNAFLPYIDVLPYDTNLDSLIASKKLTVNYKLVYQGDIDILEYQELIKNFSDDSVFYLIKTEAGNPIQLEIVKKDKIVTLNIDGSINLKEDIVSYELDKNYNKVRNVTIADIATSSIQKLSDADYDISDALLVDLELEDERKEEAEEKTSYFLLRVSNDTLDIDNLIEIEPDKGNGSYDELDVSEYIPLSFIKVGNYTYIIGEDNIIMGFKASKESLWCKLGLC